MSSDKQLTQVYGIDFGGKKTTISTSKEDSCGIVENPFGQKSTAYYFFFISNRSCVVYNKSLFEFGYQAEMLV